MHCSVLKVNFVAADVLSQEDMDKFLEESLHMTNFNHLNVLNLLGICIDSADSPMLVMPYMEHGSLLSYLRKKREYISVITANEYVVGFFMQFVVIMNIT